MPEVVGEGIGEAMRRVVKESNKGGSLDEQGIELVKKFLTFDPKNRLNLYSSLCDEYFDELRMENLQLPNGNCIPDIFDFSH